MTRPRSQTHGVLTATINDVAARAGVSKRTVSRVMNEQPNITADTRARVMKAVERLGYRPNPAARRLASGKSHLIALFHAASAPPDSGVVESVAFAVAGERYRVFACSSDDRLPDAAAEAASLARVVPIDGAILCAPLSENPSFELAFRAQKIPCVRIGPANGLYSISANDRDATRQITSYLVSLGHERIAFLCGPADSDSMRQRRQGFFDGMDLAGVVVDREIVLQGTDTFDAGVQCGRRLLSDGRRPSAILASTDTMAAGVMIAAHDLGITVPGDLSVAGFGDQSLASQVWPTLTSVRPPMRVLAGRAASLLLDLLEGVGAASEESPVPAAEIVVRNSTGAPRR